jgi:hypothetical protein
VKITSRREALVVVENCCFWLQQLCRFQTINTTCEGYALLQIVLEATKVAVFLFSPTFKRWSRDRTMIDPCRSSNQPQTLNESSRLPRDMS